MIKSVYFPTFFLTKFFKVIIIIGGSKNIYDQ